MTTNGPPARRDRAWRQVMAHKSTQAPAFSVSQKYLPDPIMPD
jgi:hypothetical protein